MSLHLRGRGISFASTPLSNGTPRPRTECMENPHSANNEQNRSAELVIRLRFVQSMSDTSGAVGGALRERSGNNALVRSQLF